MRLLYVCIYKYISILCTGKYRIIIVILNDFKPIPIKLRFQIERFVRPIRLSSCKTHYGVG